MLYRINFFIVIHVTQLLALHTLTMLLLQVLSQISTDIQVHNFYNTVASLIAIV